jgi:hypothetical protein
MKDYELSIGPFSARAHSDLELYQLIMTALKLKLIDQEEADTLCGDAAHIVTGKTWRYDWKHFRIRDCAKEAQMIGGSQS